MERFLDYFRPDQYDLALKISRLHEVISGKVIITGVVRSEVIKFHAVNMQIKSVKYASTDAPLYEPTAECEYYYDGQTLKIPVTSEMAPRFYQSTSANRFMSPEDYELSLTLSIEFESKLNHNMQGCYISSYELNGQPQQIVATQFESHYAREAFPCVDEPAAKAEFGVQLEITDLTSADTVLFNTPISNIYHKTFHFKRTPPMPTYLLAWVIGPLQSVSTVSQHGIKVTSYAALNQSIESLVFANDTAAKALDYYDEKFGVKYPLPKLDQVALPDFESGAMENWGLITYRESCMLADKNASLEVKKSVAITVTHELSHQWFGDLVTMRWWDDLWLNESFASIMEYFATAALYPEFNIWQDFFTGECLAALRRDCLRGVQSVHQTVNNPAEISTLFDSAIVYAKGARLILMLIRLMGEENFNRGIRYYFDKYKYKNTVGDNLWDALQLFANFNIKDFMHAWISQSGYPALQLDHNGDQEFWHQQRFLIDGTTDETKWPLPEVKDDMSGHYLIDWSDGEFQQKLQNFANLSQEQQLRLLIDRMLLAKATIVPSASLLDLLPNFINETSAVVWNILMMIIGDLKLFCPPETDAAKEYKTYLRNLYHVRLSAVNFHMANADVNAIQVRDMLINIAYYLEDQELLKRLADLYVEDFTKLDPEIRIYILAAKMFFDEDQLFAKFLKIYPQITNPEVKSDILYCLALARHEKNLEQLMALLKQSEIVRPQDHIFLYIYLLRNFRTREKTLDWLIANWDYVKTLTGDKSIEDYPRYAAGVLRTKAEAKKFYQFFDQFADDPILKRTLKIAHTEINARLQLISSQSDAVVKKLKLLNQKKGV